MAGARRRIRCGLPLALVLLSASACRDAPELFDPPALEYPVESVKTWLQESGFETNITVEFGSYCSLYAEHFPAVLYE